jgi:hypothetical protein
MILRNLQLNEKDRFELKTKIFASDRKNAESSSLTLNKISTCHEESAAKTRDSYGESGLNCDFLLGTNTNGDDSNSIGEARIEELIIERCRLDLEGARVLGKALRTSNSNNSAISTLKSLKMVNLSFWDEDNDVCEILPHLFEGIAKAGKRGGCLESLEFRNIAMPSSKALRSRFFSALRNCQNLSSLKLADCAMQSEDIYELAKTVKSLSNTLESLDLSRNDIDGSGLEVLLKNGLAGHVSMKRLIISHNPIGDDGAIHLSRFLAKQNQNNKQRSNKNNTNNPDATTTTTTNTDTCMGIESLQLVDCDLWSPGCARLARTLKDDDTLSELVVGSEWEQHLETVANSLKTNVALKHLHIAFDDDDDDDDEPQPHHDDDKNVSSSSLSSLSAMERIEYYLALNRGHRKISMAENLSFKLWPMILAEQTQTTTTRGKATTTTTRQSFRNKNDFRADVWYHLLRRRPELVMASN